MRTLGIIISVAIGIDKSSLPNGNKFLYTSSALSLVVIGIASRRVRAGVAIETVRRANIRIYTVSSIDCPFVTAGADHCNPRSIEHLMSVLTDMLTRPFFDSFDAPANRTLQEPRSVHAGFSCQGTQKSKQETSA
jgi:hypothetical protein